MFKERLALLEREKQLTKLQEEIAAQRRELPWVKIEKDFVFQGANGPVRLSQLFRNEETNNLIVQHVMFGGQAEKVCSWCSCWIDGVNGLLPHLETKAHYVIVCKAPYEKVAKAVAAKGWDCEALSSAGQSFNHDLGVEFTPEEIANKSGVYNFNRTNQAGFEQYSGVSVFRKHTDGNIYLTYSTYGRGLETLNSLWAMFDMLPDGRRNSDGSGNANGHGLSWWPKHPEDF